MLGLGLSIPQLAVRGLRLTDPGTAIRSLFTAGEQGVWYDPSDLTTLFQDAAGTIPVTAVEQPVGLMRDKSGRNNHAFQSTSTNRPVLSGRYNLLTKTEQFDNAAWLKTNAFIIANAVAAPDGTTTAEKLVESASTGAHFAINGAFVGANNTATFSCFLKAAERTWAALQLGDGSGGGINVWFDLQNSVLGTQDSGATGAISSVGNGWYRCSVTGVRPTNDYRCFIFTANANGVISYAGDGTSGIYIWGADLRVTNDGVGLPAYQRVNTSTDYDTAGFPLYLSFNGSNQWMQTNSIDFTGTDKMTVFAGVRKLSDAARGMVTELGGGSLLAFGVGAPGYNLTKYDFYSQGGGTAGTASINVGYAAPTTNVLTGIGNISGDQAILRINGAQVASSTADQGAGNYGNYPLYIGARAGTSLWFSGRLYSLVARGAQSTAQQIIDAETYINSKTKAYA